MRITHFHAKYYSYELSKKSATNTIEKIPSTLLDAQVDLNSHQIEATLFAFRNPLSEGVILVDEVSLGKTIETGNVIAQKWAEEKRKILIIVLANLRKQWQMELAEKFYLPSAIIKGTKTIDSTDCMLIMSYQYVSK